MNIGEEYKMKNGDCVILSGFIQDYFNRNELVVLKNKEKFFVATVYEFQANVEANLPVENRSTVEKIRIYRSYFRGRENIIASGFLTKENKMAYYPVCNNRWKDECPKQRNKRFQCSKCHIQNFQGVTDDLIFQHLKGEKPNGKLAFHGMYPMLEDNTVYFLAIDFDKKNWKHEVKSVIEGAKKFKVQPLLEISQSGNGCHIWFFFETSVPAKAARRFGELLMIQAFKENPGISFEAYDRMLPNQDELPIGGFGNLIALPLQGGRVQKGFSRFVDDSFKQIHDIWTTLEKTPKLTANDLFRLNKEMGEDLPIKYYVEKASEPEAISLFEESANAVILSNKFLKVHVRNELVIKRTELTDKELVKLKYTATFHNKAYYAAIAKRLPVNTIPRIISLARFDEDSIYLPRGLEKALRIQLPNGQFVDERVNGKPIRIKFNGSLYSEQQEALEKIDEVDMGILCGGTGFGKTVVAGKLIARKKVSTLILVHNKTLAAQWKSQLEQFLIIEDQPFEEWTPKGNKRKKSQIGKMYGGQDSRSGIIDIALFQSLSKRENLVELMAEYGMVIVDEGHHIAAKTFEDVITASSARYIYGLTATPTREDGLENILFMRLGEIVHRADKIIPKHINQKLYTRFTALGEHAPMVENNTINENYQLIMESDIRNEQIIDDVTTNLEDKRHLIVLSRYVKHCEVLKERLKERCPSVAVYILNSKMKNKDIREELLQLKKEELPFVLFTTGSFAGEGFDLPALDTLMLVMPISAKGSIQQYLGRLLRNLEEKSELRVYDYVDYAIPMIQRMYQRRMGTYRKLGYELHEDEQTGLYKSGFYDTSEFPILLEKDIENAKSIMLIIPFLTKQEFRELETLGKDKVLGKTLVFPVEESLKIQYRQSFSLMVDQLKVQGYTIKYQNKISQRFALIDESLVWILPERKAQSEGTIAMRLQSKEMNKRMKRHFGNLRRADL